MPVMPKIIKASIVEILVWTYICIVASISVYCLVSISHSQRDAILASVGIGFGAEALGTLCLALDG